MPDTWVLLESGLGAVHAITSSGSSVATCCSELSPFYAQLAEGAWVLDRSHLFTDPDALFLCLQSPLPDPSVPPGQRQPCSGVPDDLLGPAGLEAFFVAAELHRTDQDFHGLDLVALDVYASYWRNHGARIGQRRESTVLWEDGKTEPVSLIPEEAT